MADEPVLIDEIEICCEKSFARVNPKGNPPRRRLAGQDGVAGVTGANNLDAPTNDISSNSRFTRTTLSGCVVCFIVLSIGGLAPVKLRSGVGGGKRQAVGETA